MFTRRWWVVFVRVLWGSEPITGQNGLLAREHKATVSNMIDYLPIEPCQLGAVCNLLLLIKKRVYIRPWGLEQRMIGCNVWVQPIVRLHSGRIIG